jgi:hypothetical protein
LLAVKAHELAPSQDGIVHHLEIYCLAVCDTYSFYTAIALDWIHEQRLVTGKTLENIFLNVTPPTTRKHVSASFKVRINPFTLAVLWITEQDVSRIAL